MRAIVNEMKRCKREGKKGVLATVIRIKGSAYQKEGAKCFYSEDGNLVGIVSGGCVENDVIEHAKQVLKNDEAKRVNYDFQDTADDIWGLGVGCNGSIEILLEIYNPLYKSGQTEIIEKAFFSNKRQLLATFFDSSNKSKVIIKKLLYSEEEESNLFNHFELDLKKGSAKKKSQLYKVTDHMEIFVDYLDAIPELLVFGAGPDAIPLVEISNKLGWTVKVFDHRPSYLNKEHFKKAAEVYCYERDVGPELHVNESTFSVIMSHHFQQDMVILRKLLTSNIKYIGVLGPYARTKQLLTDFEDIQHERIFSPVGIDIGAVTPEEIALSIISEIVNINRNGNAVHLKDKKGDCQKGKTKRTTTVSLTS